MSSRENIIKANQREKIEEMEKYGRIITVDEAITGIEKMPYDVGKKMGKLFLETFEKYTDINSATAIRYNHTGVSIDYLIAKLKGSDRIEITLNGGFWINDEVMMPCPILGIGLLYDGHDTEFEPKFTKDAPFPLCKREYDASIHPTGAITDTVYGLPDIGIDQRRRIKRTVKKSADEIYQYIAEHMDSKDK